MIIPILIVLIIILIAWVVGFIFSTDFSVPSKSLKDIKNVLLIFPHADDEVLHTGGINRLLSQQGSKITLVVLTKGEKGTSDAHFDEKLKTIRTEEAIEATKIQGITRLIQEDFGDGELVNKKALLKKYVEDVLKEVKPDLVITYDQAGLYGHEDHIVTSEVVTELIKDSYKSISLWYVSFPKRLLAMATLPEHMAKDPKFKEKRVSPNIRVFIGMNIIPKLQAVYAYESQYDSFRNSVPLKPIPLWFFYSMWFWEYFYVAN